MKDRIAEKALVLWASNGSARVRLMGGEACKKCGAAAMGLCKPGGTGEVYLVADPVGARVGDIVTLSLDPSVRMAGLIAAYLYPLAGFVLSAIIASLATQSAHWIVLAGGGGLGLGAWLGMRRLKDLNSTARMHIERTVVDVPCFDMAQDGIGPEYARYGRVRQGLNLTAPLSVSPRQPSSIAYRA